MLLGLEDFSPTQLLLRMGLYTFAAKALVISCAVVFERLAEVGTEFGRDTW